jgi:hypothetical protein
MASDPSYMWYIVFHKTLFRECYADLSEETFAAHMRPMAVNGAIEKKVDPWFAPYVLEERKLPCYDPFLQASRFCESSVYHHMYRNWPTLVEPYDFVGCLQYDMKVDQTLFTCMNETLRSHPSPPSVLFYYHIDTAYAHLGNWIPRADGSNECLGFEGWKEIIDMYNASWKTSHTIEDVANAQIPLFHTFSIHKTIFGKIMTFAMKATPRIFELLGYNTRHLPFHLERLLGILLYLEKKEGRLTTWIQLPNIEHSDTLKDNSWGKTG